MFGTTILVRNAIKNKFTYNDLGIAFDGEGLWNFDNDFVRNVVIFGVDNSSSSQTENWKNKVSVLDKRPTKSINDRTHVAGKKNSINFSKADTKVCLGLHYNGNESYLYVNKREIYKSKAITYVGIIFVWKTYQKILQKKNRVKFI